MGVASAADGSGTPSVSSIPNDLPGNSRAAFSPVDIGAYAATPCSGIFPQLTLSPAGDSLQLCPGVPATLTATVTGGTFTSLQWQKNLVDSAGATSATLTVSSPGAYRIVGTTACGKVASGIIHVTGTALQPSVTIISSTDSICQGTSIVFTALPVNCGLSPVYQWKVNNVNAGSNYPVFTTSSLSNNDVVKVTVTTNICATPTMITSNSKTIYVTPAAPPTISITANTSAICIGNPVNFVFTAAVTNAGTTPVYQWKVNNINAGTNSATFSPASLNNGDQVKCVLSVNTLCAVNQTLTSNSITVSVTAAAPAAVSISANNPTSCAGTPLTFTAIPVNGGTPSYQWQVNGVNAGTNSPVFTSSSLVNNDAVKVTMTSSLACAIPATATSNIITTIINATPVANAGPDVSICVGSNTVLQGSGGNMYSWSPVTGLSNPFIANPVATPANTTVYTLTVTNGTCTSTDAVLVTVSAPTIPAVTIAPSSSSVCSGGTITFTGTVQNGGNNPTYQWKVNGINVGSNTPVYTSNAWQNNDQVTLTVNVTSGCSTIPTATSLPATITVATLADPIVVLTANVLTVTNPASGAVYTWQVKTGSVWADIVPAATGISYTSTAAGDYRVKATKGPCTKFSASQTTSLISGIEDPELIYLRVFPNPSRRVVTVDRIALIQHWQTLTIESPAGQTLIAPMDVRNRTSVSVDIRKLPVGFYFIKMFREDGKIWLMKFIKE